MEILQARIVMGQTGGGEGHGYYRPQMEFLVDVIPQMTYQKKKAGGYNYYFAEQDGLVKFFVHSGNKYDENGFGGATRVIKVEGGSPEIITGGWSSRPGVLNQYFPHSHKVVVTDNPESYEQGYTFIGMYATVEKIRQTIAQFKLDCQIERDPHSGEVNYRLMPGFVNYSEAKHFEEYCVIEITRLGGKYAPIATGIYEKFFGSAGRKVYNESSKYYVEIKVGSEALMLPATFGAYNCYQTYQHNRQ